MSDDDLDDFFDEVEEVVEEAKKVSENDVSTIATDALIDDKGSPQLHVQQQTSGNGEEEGRPAKKARTLPSNPEATNENSRGGAVIVSKKAATTTTRSKISAPPTIHNKPTSSNDGVYQITVPQECLNPPIPPPPPPAPPGPPPPPPSAWGHPHEHAISAQGSSAVAKPSVRIAAGKKWTDATLTEFPENDYRLFVGNLDKIITEAKLAEAFQSKYPSFVLCRIIYDKISGTSKGYGFVSLMDPKDCAKAIREMDQSWLGSRPIKVKRSDWKERDVREIRKESNKKRKGARSRRR